MGVVLRKSCRLRASVTMLLRRGHFDSCFPLNRFMLLLTKSWLAGPAKKSSMLDLRHHAQLVDVLDPARQRKTPAISWRNLAGQVMQAEIEDLNHGGIFFLDCELPIVRHGVPGKTPALLDGRPRHILPAHWL
jgi:hypothetical protein